PAAPHTSQVQWDATKSMRPIDLKKRQLPPRRRSPTTGAVPWPLRGRPPGGKAAGADRGRPDRL
ncbi:MAG: hypothetical protein M0Z36_00595, partial [Thermaerobacter sp.]|nr:hypothetical protein [Thermaerobacter sp.]